MIICNFLEKKEKLEASVFSSLVLSVGILSQCSPLAIRNSIPKLIYLLMPQLKKCRQNLEPMMIQNTFNTIHTLLTVYEKTMTKFNQNQEVIKKLAADIENFEEGFNLPM